MKESGAIFFDKNDNYKNLRQFSLIWILYTFMSQSTPTTPLDECIQYFTYTI